MGTIEVLPQWNRVLDKDPIVEIVRPAAEPAVHDLGHDAALLHLGQVVVEQLCQLGIVLEAPPIKTNRKLLQLSEL